MLRGYASGYASPKSNIPALPKLDPLKKYKPIWNNHAKHGNRGALFYKFLSFLQKRQHTCSICNSHPTAVQCPVLLGHVGSSEPMGEDGGGRGQTERKAPEVFHVEWREGPGQRKRKKRAGEEPEHQGRVHTRFKDTPASNDTARPSPRRHTPMPGYGDGLLRFFERGTRVSDSGHDGTDTIMAADTTGSGYWSKILIKELLKRIQKLQSPLIQTLQRLSFLQLEPEKGDSYMFPRMKWNSSKQAMEALEEAPLTLNQASQTVTRMLTLLQRSAGPGRSQL